MVQFSGEHHNGTLPLECPILFFFFFNVKTLPALHDAFHRTLLNDVTSILKFL